MRYEAEHSIESFRFPARTVRASPRRHVPARRAPLYHPRFLGRSARFARRKGVRKQDFTLVKVPVGCSRCHRPCSDISSNVTSRICLTVCYTYKKDKIYAPSTPLPFPASQEKNVRLCVLKAYDAFVRAPVYFVGREADSLVRPTD